MYWIGVLGLIGALLCVPAYFYLGFMTSCGVYSRWNETVLRTVPLVGLGLGVTGLGLLFVNYATRQATNRDDSGH